ncbi:hypothetical protein FACS1894159_01360 [Bacteroidia bacterium]|nr:hypothetical protein FACS1894159_01360 [Bacteroidia bacterium]
MQPEIEHNGVVVSVGERSVDVSMTVDRACEGCKAQAICGMGEQGERMVTVWSDFAAAFAPGEEVVVSMTRAMGVRAVTWCYVMPVLVMLAVLLGGSALGLGEAVTGGGALAAVVLYYFGLWLMRHRIEKVIMFKIRKM